MFVSPVLVAPAQSNAIALDNHIYCYLTGVSETLSPTFMHTEVTKHARQLWALMTLWLLIVRKTQMLPVTLIMAVKWTSAIIHLIINTVHLLHVFHVKAFIAKSLCLQNRTDWCEQQPSTGLFHCIYVFYLLITQSLYSSHLFLSHLNLHIFVFKIQKGLPPVCSLWREDVKLTTRWGCKVRGSI